MHHMFLHTVVKIYIGLFIINEYKGANKIDKKKNKNTKKQPKAKQTKKTNRPDAKEN